MTATVLRTNHAAVMPGRGGVRAPLPRFVQPDGAWGYVIGSARLNDGHSRNLYNFIGHDKFFDMREKDDRFHDMRTLMERNVEDNRRASGNAFRCWSDLWGRHEGEILVLAGCGPSLTQSLPALYRYRDRFRLMCVNRAHRAFHGCKPDYYYFVERRGLPDWAHGVDGPLDLSGITMIGTPACDTRVVRAFDEHLRYWGWTSLGSLGATKDVAALKSYDVKGATTIGNAPYIALKMGFRKVVCVGTDFSLDVRVLADDTRHVVEPRRLYFDRMWNQTHYAQDPHFASKLVPMIGHDGHACMADANLIGHRDYFMAVLDIVQYEAGLECVNASPRGLLNWNVKPLEEALEV